MMTSSSARLVASFALALVCVGFLPFLLIYVRFPAIAARRLDPQIEQTAVALSKLPDTELRQQIAFFTDRTDQSFLVGVFSPSKHALIGNLNTLPEDLPIDGKTHEIQLSTPLTHSLTLHAAAISGADDDIIVVARVPIVLAGVSAILQDTFFFWILPAIVISVIIGAGLGWRTQKQAATMSDTLQRIKLGGLNERLPARNGNSSFDKIASDINSMLDEINRLMTELMHVGANLAHDLRSPLTRMQMRLRARHEHSGAGSNTEMLCELLETDIEQTLRLVDALLRLAEIDSRRQNSHFHDVDLPEVIETLLDFYAPLAAAREIHLSSECPPISIRGDQDLLIEAFGNLVENAIKFNKIGGNVHVRAYLTPANVTVEVSDTGAGLNGLELGVLLDRFHRRNAMKHQPGYGLGLSLVASIARLHGAELMLKDTGTGAVASLAFSLSA